YAEWLNEVAETDEGRDATRHWNTWKPAPPAARETPFDLPHAEGVFTPRFLPIDPVPHPWSHVLARWRMLISNFTGGSASVGLICPGRDDQSLAATIGPVSFCAPLPAVDSAAPFAEILRDTEQQIQNCRDWGVHFPPAAMDGFTFSWDESPALAHYAVDEKFKLHLSVTANGAQLGYDASRISAEGAECVARGLEVRRVWKPTPRAPAIPVPAVTLHALFEQQARRTPDRIAVIDEGSQLTFSELNAAADRIAAALEPKALIDLVAERS